MSKENDLNEINIDQLYLLYKKEFIIFCENILIENQKDFLDEFYEKIDLIIKSEYGENIFDRIPSLYLTKKQCENKFITDIYWPMLELCVNAKKIFQLNKANNSNYLTNFRPHCLFDEVPLHICGSKFIQVFDKENKIKCVICSGCNKCYYSNFIPMNCHYCQINFYSEAINNKNILFPATWKKYHCNNERLLINEQMHCIFCNNLLYIRNNKLFCKNCKEYFNPEDIIWTCKICHAEFKSDIKIYNPYEFKEKEIVKKNAFLYKKITSPKYLPCNCLNNNNLIDINFCHEPGGKCKGVMYYCFFNNKEFLVCSACNKIFELNKFFWVCPICFKKFLVNELQFEDISNVNNNNLYKRNQKRGIILEAKNNKQKKIFNSCSQKLLETEKNIFINSNKFYKNKNNSYVKKRINSSFEKSNKRINTSIEKNDYNNGNNNQIQTTKRKILIKNSNIINNNNTNSNKEINSFQNKYNVASTAYSSFINNNLNIKIPQTDRNSTNSYMSSKNEKIIEQNKYKINKYINKKILNNSSTIINNKCETNRKIYLKSKYKNIEQYINDFNFTDNNDNKNSESSSKSIFFEKNKENKEYNNEFFKTVKNGFSKYNKNKCKDNSFYANKKDENKSFLSQKTDIKQIYFPKKYIHIRHSSLAAISTSPLNKPDKNIMKYNHSCEKRKINNIFFNDNKNLTNIKIFSDVKNISKDTSNNKAKNRKRNYINNIYQNATENNKGSSISSLDISKKNIKNNDIYFQKYTKVSKINYNKHINKNIRPKNEINNFMKLNLENISNINSINNKHKGNKNSKKNIEYLTSINHPNNYINKPKYKKDNVNKKNQGNINKKLQPSQTKIEFTQRSQYRNSKRSGLTEIISNFNELKINTTEINTNTKDKNENNKELRKIKYNINKTTTNENNNSILKEDSKDKNNNVIITQNTSNEEDELKIFNFEEYKIITQLGQGSFGKIYLVQNSKNELFTMKKLVYSEELDVQTVIKEYKMCYKIKHPNVVKILGIYSKKLDKTTYVVYVLMEVGLTDWEKEIKTHVEKNIYYTEKELIHIIKQLTQVLSFLQKSNISHRDIKPQNILVFKNNIYKIADFGEAKKIENMTINLISNSLRGTELYMSPLLFNGLRTGQVDIKHNAYKSDVYSFGLCILFAASLQMISLYDIRKIVDMKELRKYLDKTLGKHYSKKFVDLIELLLEIHEKNRPDFIRLEEIIKDWEIN